MLKSVAPESGQKTADPQSYSMQSPPGYGPPPPQPGYGPPPPQPGYGPPGNVVQPQYFHPPPASQTTVIVQQPGATVGAKYRTTRDWSTATCDCFEDLPSCLLGWFCLPCYECHLSMRMGESCCVPMCVPGAMITLRTKLRAEQGIQGSVCNDCITQACCGPCATCQLAREMNYIEANHL